MSVCAPGNLSGIKCIKASGITRLRHKNTQNMHTCIHTSPGKFRRIKTSRVGDLIRGTPRKLPSHRVHRYVKVGQASPQAR